MTWFYLAFLSAVLFAGAALLARILAVKSENPRAFSFLYNLCGALFALILFSIQHISISIPSREIIFLTFLGAFFYGIFERVNFYVRKDLESSIFIILFELSPLITFIGALIFLGESLTILKVLAAILIISGNITLVYKSGTVKYNKKLLVVLLTVLSFGLARLLDKKVSAYYPIPLYVFLIWLIPNIFVFLPYIKIKSLKKEIELASWKIPLLAVTNVTGFYVLIKALQLADVSKVTLISSTNALMVVFAGMILLKEKSNVIRKILAAILVVSGVLLLRY